MIGFVAFRLSTKRDDDFAEMDFSIMINLLINEGKTHGSSLVAFTTHVKNGVAET